MALRNQRQRFSDMATHRQGNSDRNSKQNFEGSGDKMRYEYPAIISYSNEDKVYYVDFPDMTNCFTDGATLREALDNAEDVLNLILSYREDKGDALPEPSDLNSLHVGENEIVALINTVTQEPQKIAV